ncbi:putative membrane protein YczE [Gracilibacillus halotolerans]|uniref:Putative membrane protein YczE n=1 Tax=Gracilibacillus halotolerans TaxID=74386 RepID=A0A841RMT5_9BACI|nr:DUF6198 family protein [Gracilibacillus halotolerans]MBB6513809.1 putative membrane protein YczE [Gracilibacillus halotolerans]
MKHHRSIIKRITLYLVGLFFLSLGVSISILADLGVSPVSSLAYAMALTSGLSVGMMTIVANLLFIVVQVILNKRFNLRESVIQLIIAILFGSFVDMTLFLVRFLPPADTLVIQWLYLIISLFVISIGLLGYFSAKLTLMPYDELTHVIGEKFNIVLSKAKITSDLLSVIIAALICIIFLQSFGAVGIGTLLAAYFVGRILGWLIRRYQKHLIHWLTE